jgi:Ser/Thr protein kinase RdoA (MazF antagonist)
MKPFEQLSTRGQTSRLRALAEAALTCYDLHDAHIALLSHRENTMFRVTLPPQGNSSGNASKDTTSGGKFVLRLYGRQVPRVAMIQSELLWLEALRRETELDVPEPVPGRDGSLVTEVVSAEVPGPRLCVLFRWVEGRFIHTALTPAQIERVGMFMARLHRHSTQFVPPPTFVRPHWEWTEVLGKGTVVDPAFVAEKGNGLISPKSSALFSAVAERVRMEMQAIPQNADYYGLIHGDFQHTNYLF